MEIAQIKYTGNRPRKIPPTATIHGTPGWLVGGAKNLCGNGFFAMSEFMVFRLIRKPTPLTDNPIRKLSMFLRQMRFVLAVRNADKRHARLDTAQSDGALGFEIGEKTPDLVDPRDRIGVSAIHFGPHASLFTSQSWGAIPAKLVTQIYYVVGKSKSLYATLMVERREQKAHSRSSEDNTWPAP